MLTVRNLVKEHRLPSKGHRPARVTGIHGINLEIQESEFFTLLGPSGCGKTTTLRSIAGLEVPDSGQITLENRVIFDSSMRIDLPVSRRGLAMVFQSYAIWPHMSVFENVAFPLLVTSRRVRPSKNEIKQRVGDALEVVGLGGLAGQNAMRLSGGQQQRLALARAIVIEPPVLLLDEPLSNLDARLREGMRVELKRLQHDLGLTTVYVTHDQAEALSMSNRIAVMDDGVVVQVAAPRDLYQNPANPFVADFLGESNLIKATVAVTGANGVTVDTPFGPLRAIREAGPAVGKSVIAVLRPEDVTVSTAASVEPSPNVFPGRIIATAFLGDRVDHVVSVRGGLELRVRSDKGVRLQGQADVHLSVDPADVVLLTE